MSTQKRLFLLDAYALIFRGYYAFIKNPRINSKGMDTSAIMGFMNSLLDVIKREKPDHLAVAFDKEGSRARTEMFAEYKANRDETPEAIKIAVPYIQELLKAMHIPIIELAGCEADDLIGTIAKQAEKQNYKVYMVTPDKDFAQLVSENIFMYKPARMGNGIEIWGVPEVLAKFEVERPEQVIDFLGMMGDAVDNIPGLPGVGEVTAKKFLKEFGSMENLLANTDKLKGKMKENIEANKDKGILSKKLAAIMCDCDVVFNEDDYELSRPDIEKTDAIFQELEFRRMAEQFDNLFKVGAGSESGSTPAQDAKLYKKPQPKNEDQFDLFGGGGTTLDENAEAARNSFYNTLENTEHSYQTVQGDLGIKLLLQNLQKQTSVCFDTETTGIDALHAELVGMSFSYEKGKAFYVPFPESQEEAKVLIDKFVPFFENENIEKIGQNLKYDLKILSNYGVTVKGKLFDTMIAHYLINPDMRHNMDILAETYLKYSPKSIETLIGKKGKNQLSMRDVPLEDIKEYAAEDADVTLQLKEIFTAELEKTETKKLFDEIEIPLVSVLADMETEGIRLDVEFLKQMSKEMDVEIKSLEEQIYETAGEKFNLASPKQLGDILFDKLKIGGAKQKKTKTGQYATGEEVLTYLANDNPIVKQILDWRQMVKLQSTYILALPEQVDKKTLRVHTDYMQTVAATGRLSSNNPNLQNIPIRTERGRQIRKAFVARDENYTLISADYSQIELRIIAALSGEENMIAAFQNGEDIHRATAAKVFDVALEEVSREQRSNAKTVNFGIIYGVSAFGLSNQTSLSRSESAALIDAYYKTYPRLKSYISEQVDFAREKGYVQTILGRRRYLKDINSANAVVRSAAERNAVNAPIQGSAADVIKIAMINIHKKLREENWKSKMLLQVHDELVFDVHNDELEKIQPMIKHEMENAFKMSVPLEVELGLGKDWLEAH
ncbi:DNA polymerase I [Flavobacterium johnsoniae]|uniref:DNA polymerase I n=1 Tax=Flavobacterium johnsoniae (strain ATCC 17061 / DSM 2064 / JCM 8514 / BCRC 14874 / CCUG 350202 / NBRC 14942 / NCIMB 11054 / UW101) TaxID=376686 RepID=A5FJH6_FLAJ1|nr:DNA polymerase I [Flavobacterium johnsoniae]ABQ04649.1 DNA polymerase I [Flavobacterium johnsoniae UW101]OXE97969.1 DNA polymerase I [Flavobacterium johnsoniae UW101]WQG83555.1 DNA polymerase I [Flavobacterium johnsoniae UW101]SHK29237.1 DNA polymerase I [Flavobacterium johnsoniae]